MAAFDCGGGGEVGGEGLCEMGCLDWVGFGIGLGGT